MQMTALTLLLLWIFRSNTVFRSLTELLGCLWVRNIRIPAFGVLAMSAGLRLLSLDGGGVRGLSSLYILKRLLETIDPENPPQPWQFFHMIGGTSTGGYVLSTLSSSP